MVLEGIEEAAESSIQVWPNPTHGLLHIETENLAFIEIRNLLGQVVLQAEQVETVDLSHFEKGVYFLIANNKNGAKTVTKIIKE